MDKQNKIAHTIGQIFGIVLIGCVVGCLGGIAIAGTVKFLTWIF